MSRRNRPATEQKLLDAARSLTIEAGFPGCGINQVARLAGVDKVLIYRYFGDIDGLLNGLAERTAFFPAAQAHLADLSDAMPALEAFANAYLSDLSEPLHSASYAGSLTASNPVTDAFWRQDAELWSLVGDKFTESQEAWRHTLAIWRGLLQARACESYRPAKALRSSLAASSPLALLALAQSGTELANPSSAEVIPEASFTPPVGDVLPDRLL